MSQSTSRPDQCHRKGNSRNITKPIFLFVAHFLGSRRAGGSCPRGFPKGFALPTTRCSVVFMHNRARPRGSRRSGPKSVASFTCQQQSPCPRPARHCGPAVPASCALLPGGARNPNKSQGEHTRDMPQVGDTRNQRTQGCVTGARASPAPGTSPYRQGAPGPAAPHIAARLIRQSFQIPLRPKASRATHGESAAVNHQPGDWKTLFPARRSRPRRFPSRPASRSGGREPTGQLLPCPRKPAAFGQAASGSRRGWWRMAGKWPQTGPELLSVLPRQGRAHPTPHPHGASRSTRRVRPSPRFPSRLRIWNQNRSDLGAGRGNSPPGEPRQSEEQPHGARVRTWVSPRWVPGDAALCSGTRSSLG